MHGLVEPFVINPEGQADGRLAGKPVLLLLRMMTADLSLAIATVLGTSQELCHLHLPVTLGQ